MPLYGISIWKRSWKPYWRIILLPRKCTFLIKFTRLFTGPCCEISAPERNLIWCMIIPSCRESFRFIWNDGNTSCITWKWETSKGTQVKVSDETLFVCAIHGKMERNVISLHVINGKYKGWWELGTFGFVWKVGMACLISWVMFCFYFSPPCVCNEMAECTLTISAWNHSEVWLPHPSYLYRPLSRAASLSFHSVSSQQKLREHRKDKRRCAQSERILMLLFIWPFWHFFFTDVDTIN